jgi:hypothetical protein
MGNRLSETKGEIAAEMARMKAVAADHEQQTRETISRLENAKFA